MSRRKNFRQSDWLIELSPRKNVEPRIVGIRSAFRGSTFFRLVEIRLNWLIKLSPRKNFEPEMVGIRSNFRGSTFSRLVEIRL